MIDFEWHFNGWQYAVKVILCISYFLELACR